MNIDDLKPLGSENQPTNAVPSVPVSTPAPAPAPVAAPAPANDQTQNLPTIEEAQQQMTPFSSAPAPEVQPSPEVATEVASFSPTEAVIPKEAETIVAPVPIPNQAPVVDNSAGGNLPPSPAPTTVDNSGLPPLPEPTVAPVNTQGVTVVNTTKAKSQSNLFLVVLALLLVLFVLNIDTVINFVQLNILHTNPTSPGNTENNNLVDGFIKINDGESSYTIKEIKFYNFIKSGDNKLLINYSSERNYTKVEDLKLYVEVYNSNKELLTKEQFIVKSIGNSEVGSFIMSVSEQIYNLAFYAKIVTYSDEDLNKKTNLTCTYNESNENYLLEYKTVYSFVNNGLIGYEVNKKIETINANKATSNAISVIEKEKSDVEKFEITTKYENNVLNYNIDLNNVNEGYIPIYSKDTSPTIVKINDTQKKWICE